MSLAQHERKKAELLTALANEKVQHDKTVAGIRRSLETVNAAILLATAGLDEAKLQLAESVLDVFSDYNNAGEDRALVLEQAVQLVLAKGSLLKVRFVGTKNYAHWHGQAVEIEYGYGPKHGWVIFRIGLHEAVRRRTGTELLTDDEVEAAVYYLRNLERIHAARRDAKAAAAAVPA
ncbi:hypothetical protein [Aquincola tertiaricarbonis]|uniref:hypothetical protein n=1 Tax=Aquincola tertiaricarbonis TaxID=391953 RepID=UPI00061510FA|nr:hypothetical protein [Aquincola tertiaricarbonis]